MPIFEAAYSGLPVVATGWSGQLDFLVDENGNSMFYNVAFDYSPYRKNCMGWGYYWRFYVGLPKRVFC